jgi:two-component system phosphate regulon sensor histidine kinase PhoR
MGRGRLVWRLCATYLVVIVLTIGGVGGYTLQRMRGLYLAETRAGLEARARLLADQVREGDAPADPARLDALCKRQGRATGTRFTIVRADGVVLGDTERDPAVMDNHGDRPEIRAALGGETGERTRFSWTLEAEQVYVAVPLRADGRIVGVVRAERPLAAINAALRRVYGAVALGGLTVVLLAAGLGLLVAQWISRPLREMAAGARRFAGGELKHKLVVSGAAEVVDLADSLNHMAAELDRQMRTATSRRNEQEAILASLVEGVVALDPDERILRLNQAAAGLLGTTPAAAAGRTLTEVVRSVDLERYISRLRADGAGGAAQVVIRRGDERVIEVRGLPLRDADGHELGALLVFHDVTRLQRLETLRRDFVANVSHELKTPITTIKGFVETLREGAVADPPKAARFLDILARQTDRLAAIIDDLLDLSRIEHQAERQEVDREPADLRALLQAAVTTCEPGAAQRGVTIRLLCPPDLTFLANAALIEQAVVNLLKNAIAASEPGHQVEVEGGLVNGDLPVRIQVRDQGCGIAAEHLPRIFERFYRVDPARSRDLGGTGLGLAIVKHIVEAHGGRISVDSAPGQGSTFTLLCPAD